MLNMKNMANKFAVEVEEGSWNRKKLPFKPLSRNDLLDFPEISLNDLKILFTGIYQLGQAIAYFGEIVCTDGDVSDMKVHQLKAQKGLQVIKTEVHSKCRSQVMWGCYIKYRPNQNINSIVGYACNCPNEDRTIGACCHVSAIIHYLANARY